MKRTCVVTGLAVLVALLSSVPAWATQMSDKERMALGVKLYESQKYEEAVQAFEEVNPANLSYWDQQKLPDMLRRSKEGLARQAQARTLMTEGEQAYKQGRWGTAVTKFRQSQKADHLGTAGERRIDSLVQVAEETEKKHRTDVLKLLQEARLAEAANQNQKAIDGYRAVLAADVLISDADRAYARNHLAALTGAPAPQAPVEVAQVDTMDPVVSPAAPVEIEVAPVQAPVEVEVASQPAETPATDVTPLEVVPEQPAAVQQTPATNWEEIRRQREAAQAAQGRTLLEQYGSDIDVERQRVIAQVREQVLQAQAIARAAETPRDLNDALTRLDNAQRMIDSFPYFTPQGREDLTEEVMLARRAINRQREDMLAEIDRQRRQEIEVTTKERVRAVEEQRQQSILSLWQTAEDYAEVNDYASAANVLGQLLRLDPDNERARRRQDRYAFWAMQKRQLSIRTDRTDLTKEALKGPEEAAIPREGLVYPPDWDELTAKRRKFVMEATGEPEAILQTRERMETKGIINGQDWSIPLVFQDATLGNVLAFIAETARAQPRNVNIRIDRRGIDESGVSLDDTITLDVRDVSIEQALRMVLTPELDYRIEDDGSVLISSRARLYEILPRRTFFVQDLITPIPDFGDSVPKFNLTANLEGGSGASTGTSGSSIFDTATTTTDTEEDGAQRLRELIEKTVKSAEPWDTLGGRATLDFYNKSGLMIVSQTPDGLNNVAELLESLRREHAIMVSVEARFITVADSFLNDVTFDFDIAYAGSGNWGPITIESNSGAYVAGILPPLTNTPNVPSTASGSSGIGITGSFLDDIQVNFLLRAIQSDRRSTTLFAPRLTLWNGQRSWITDGVQQAYVAELEPVVAEAAVGFNVTVGVAVSGAVLDVKATVSADRRYVQLDLRPQVALPPTFENVVIQAGSLVTASAELMLPTIRITDLRTSVSVPDGGTLLIGGMKVFEENDIESGVPVLSKVPILKRLFTNRVMNRGQQNLLILVKPSIIIQSEKEAELGYPEWVNN